MTIICFQMKGSHKSRRENEISSFSTISVEYKSFYLYHLAILAQGWPNGDKEESSYSTKCGAEGFNARLTSPTGSF
jgi:hypothetical protein